MKNCIQILIIILLGNAALSQNVGQKGDTLKNYTDINGLKQGYWQKKYYNGNIKYEVYFKNNKPIGEFKRFYESGK